jgi:hypothetical protein
LIPGFRIWDPGSGSGLGKKSGSRSGIRIRDQKLRSYFESWETIFLVKILKFSNVHPGSRIRDGKNSDLGSGIQDAKNFDPGSGIWDGKNLDPGSRIRDKHPGSEKLEISSPNLLGLKEPNNNRTLCGKGILGGDQVIFAI